MGCRRNCICSRNYRHLTVSVLFLLVSSSMQVRFMAEGRVNSKLAEISQTGREAKVVVRAQIGSRPPRCEGRCSWCGHCEAVQVPAVPQAKRINAHSSTVFTVFYYRGEDNSNYKPMSWKCKCGDMLFNP